MRRFSRTLAILAGLTLLASACGGGGDDSGSSGSGDSGPITIGAVFDLSGPTSDVGTPYARGIRDYVKFINANGGVNGRQVELLSQDYRYEVPQAEQLYSQYVSRGAVAFIGWGTADTEALRARVNADKVPFISASYSENLANPEETPYNFFPGPSYSDQMRVVLKWISEQEEGETEVAVFHHDSPFGKSPLEDGQKYIEENELAIGYETYAMPNGATDYVGELSQAKSQGAKYIIVQNVPSPASKLLQNIKAQDMDVQVITLNYAGDELLVRLAGDSAEGVIGAMPFAPPAAASGGLDDINTFLESEGASLDDDPYFPQLRYVQGWYTAAVFLEGIGNADEISGEAIKAGLERISGYDTGVGPAVTFSAEDHSGMDGASLYKVEGEAWTKLTDDLTP